MIPVVKGKKLKGNIKVNHRLTLELAITKGSEFISINIIAAICWPPPLILQLFFKAAPFFTAWLFCADLWYINFKKSAMVS